MEDGSTICPIPHHPIIDIRFGADQPDMLRACGDLEYRKTNEFCAAKTPISLPTYDHFGQMALNVFLSGRPLPFLKTDHSAAYKQVPIRPDRALLATIARRVPVSDLWAAAHPRSLVFGSTAAVVNYNCLSRCLASFISKTSASLRWATLMTTGPLPHQT